MLNADKKFHDMAMCQWIWDWHDDDDLPIGSVDYNSSTVPSSTRIYDRPLGIKSDDFVVYKFKCKYSRIKNLPSPPVYGGPIVRTDWKNIILGFDKKVDVEFLKCELRCSDQTILDEYFLPIFIDRSDLIDLDNSVIITKDEKKGFLRINSARRISFKKNACSEYHISRDMRCKTVLYVSDFAREMFLNKNGDERMFRDLGKPLIRP